MDLKQSTRILKYSSSHKMPVLPKNLAAICNVDASIVQSDKHVGMLCSAGDISVMLRIAADADNNSDICIDIDSNLVVRAFIFE